MTSNRTNIQLITFHEVNMVKWRTRDPVLDVVWPDRGRSVTGITTQKWPAIVQIRIVRFLEIDMNADRLFPRVWFLLAGNNYYLTCDLATQKRQYTNYKWFTWNIYLVLSSPSFPKFEWFKLHISNGCGMSTEEAYASGTLVMSYFWLVCFIMSLSERVTFPD